MLDTRIRLDYILFSFILVLLARSFLLNSFIICAGLFLLLFIVKKKVQFEISFKPIIFSFLFFYCYIVVISFFATDINSAFKSSISQVRFFLFFLFLIYLPKLDEKKFYNSLNYVKIFLIFFCLDLFYQFATGQNFFGIVTGGNDPARFSGLFGDELVAGTFIYFLSIPLFFHIFYSFKNVEKKIKIFDLIFITLISTTIIITGDRMAIILYFSSIIVGLVFLLDLKKIIYSLSIILTLIIVLYFSLSVFKKRVDQSIFELNNIKSFSYYRLFSSSYNLWKENIIFGVGLKNYREDCSSQKIDKNTNLKTLCSTHPHNNFLELLVETGIVGFGLFVLFLYNLISLIYVKLKHNFNNLIYLKGYVLGLVITLAFFLWPIKSSGSMFSTFYMSFFWFNLGMLLNILKKNNS